jgi:hypothetical protein
MVSGAVMIGRPLGLGWNDNQFNLSSLRDLKEKCNLGLIIRHAVQVAYPESLNPKNNLAYSEGVLCDIYGGEGRETPKKFEEDIRERLIIAAKFAEKVYCESIMKREKPWYSNLHHENIARQDIKDSKVVWEPHMQVLMTYPEDEKLKYFEVASGLLFETKRARIKRSREHYEQVAKNDLSRLGEKYIERKDSSLV